MEQAASGRQQRPRKRTQAAVLIGGAVLAAARGVFQRAGRAYVPAPLVGTVAFPAAGSARTAARTARQATGAQPAPQCPSLWQLVGGAGLAAAATLAQSARRRSGAPKAEVSLGLVAANGSVPEESVVAMNTAGGRRRRLGVGARCCMLTGRKKVKGFTRTYNETKNKRFWRPNTRWKKLWWEREQKWVRLYISAQAIKNVDAYGLENCCRWAGLDLYAWCMPHWMPGSRQPLALKIGYSSDSKNHLKLWPDYIKKLNNGAALADQIRGTPEELNDRLKTIPKRWRSGWAPDPNERPKRLSKSKMIADLKQPDS